MSESVVLKKTPLHSEHVRLGAKMVDFGGWDMPIQYKEGILSEHKIVREDIGIFDVSHMGEINVKGEQALEFCEYLVTNSIKTMKFGEICYTLMCMEDGGIVDDLLVYKIDNKYALLVVNASNVEKDYEWIKKQSENFDVKVENVSDYYAQIALQGPNSEKLIENLCSVVLEDIGFYHFEMGRINGIQAIISRTGYTGEDGFEFYVEKDAAIPLWRKLLELGAKPAGLGSRDLLRFEACYMLYGNEINSDITPLEAGLKWAVDLEKNFVGSKTLVAQKNEGLSRKLRGLEVIEKGGIPRHGNRILTGGEEIGFVTTGNKSPSAGKVVALGYIPSGYKLGDEVDIEIRENKTVKAKVIKTPFYRGSVKSKKK